MKKLFIIICLLANIVVLGACGDVESVVNRSRVYREWK